MRPEPGRVFGWHPNGRRSGRSPRRARLGDPGGGRLPLVVAAARLVPLVSSGWTPIRDDALLELRTADVGSRSVLLGPYSRFGWHHPGPSLFYVLALPYRLLGRPSVALPLTAVAINLVAVVGIAVLAYRRGGRTLLVAVLLVVEVYLATLGPWVLR